MTAAPVSDKVIRVPGAGFYWAVLDTPAAGAVRRTGPLPAGVWPDLADHVPVSVDELHAVCRPASDGRLMVCALSRTELEAIGADTMALCPDSIPPELDAAAVDPVVFNMLVGAYEPRPIRRARARSRLATAATLLTLVAVVIVGSMRRAGHAQRVAQQASSASAALLAKLDLSKATPRQLQTEAERLRQSAGVDLRQKRPRDAAVSLQAILSAWPLNTTARPQSISIGPDGATLAILVPENPGAFVQSLRPPEGWKLDEPSLVSVEKQTRINVRMRASTPEARP